MSPFHNENPNLIWLNRYMYVHLDLMKLYALAKSLRQTIHCAAVIGLVSVISTISSGVVVRFQTDCRKIVNNFGWRTWVSFGSLVWRYRDYTITPKTFANWIYYCALFGWMSEISVWQSVSQSVNEPASKRVCIRDDILITFLFARVVRM